VEPAAGPEPAGGREAGHGTGRVVPRPALFEPAQCLAVRYDRGLLEQARGRDAAALAAFRAIEPLARRLASPHLVIPRARAQVIHSLVRLGQAERAGQVLDGLAEQDRDHPEIRIAAAALRLAEGNPAAALTELAPVLSPVLALLERHGAHRTAHASLVAEIRALWEGARLVPPPSFPEPLAEPLSGSEIRVPRYLPTNLTAPEIARELSVSPNTARTHIKSLYAKLGTHLRAGAVERARALGLRAPPAVASRRGSPRAV
jgi:LuxR family transcriptional regulator, maltose regulon positive regulatory protein